jgi:tRNA (guanine-N1)-methyltransferase
VDVYLVALFPEVLDGFTRSSIVGRAVTQGLVRFHGVQIRDFSTNKHHTVDDAPYGGGSGMVMTAPAVVGAIESLPVSPETGEAPYRILMSPTGRPFTQSIARELSARPRWPSCAAATRASTSGCAPTSTTSSPSGTSCSPAASPRRWR